MSPKKPTQKSAKSTNENEGFTAEEKAAMRSARPARLKDKTDGESAVRAAIAEMSPQDRAMAKRLHEVVTATAPDLSPKTWYGMPAYAKDGKVVCFFRNAGKFKERYAMFGFNDTAKLDEGSMWPIAFALKKVTPAEEKKIAALVKKAVARTRTGSTTEIRGVLELCERHAYIEDAPTEQLARLDDVVQGLDRLLDGVSRSKRWIWYRSM